MKKFKINRKWEKYYEEKLTYLKLRFATILTSIKLFFENFFKLIRWNEWAVSKLSLIFLVFYYQIYATQSKGWNVIFMFFNLVVFLCFLAAFGYSVNDYSDKTIDVIAGKKKAQFSTLRVKTKLLLFGFCFGGIGISFPFWHKSFVILALIIVTYILAAFYSLPPKRFKEKGWLGIIISSLTQRTLPILICFTVFERFGADTILWTLLALIIGIRAMFVHQIKDYNDDKKSGVKTLIVNWGIIKGIKFLFAYIVPLEIIFIALITLYLCLHFFLLGLSVILCLMLTLLTEVKFSQEWLHISVISNESFLSNFYYLFLPLTFTMLLSFSSLKFLILPLFHLFWSWRLVHSNVIYLRTPTIILNKSVITNSICLKPAGNSWQFSFSPFYTEWWYFDVLFDDGSFLGGSFALNGYLPVPETVQARVEFALNLNNEGMIKICKDFPYSYFNFNNELGQLTIGRNRIRNKKENLYLNLEEDNIEINLNYKSIIEGFQIGEEGKIFFLKSWDRYFGWAVPFPMADVVGEIKLNGANYQVRGRGYQDHNWGTVSLKDNVSCWHWLRLMMNGKVLLLAKLVLRESQKPIVFIGLNENKKWLFFSCKQNNCFNISFNPTAEMVKSGSKKYFEYHIYYKENNFIIDLQFQIKDILKFTLRPKRTISLISETPYYIRLLSSAYGKLVMNNKLENIKAEVIHEYSSF